MVNFNPVSTLEHLQNINNAQNQKVIQSLYNSDVPRKHINDNNENTTPQIPITENIAQDSNNKSSASKMSNSDFDPSFSFETSNELNETVNLMISWTFI